MYETIDRAAFEEAGGSADTSKSDTKSGIRIALIGGFLPRRCGIATFTTDIYESLKAAAPELAVDIYAMTPATGAVAFDPEICSTIAEGDAASFVSAARRIEASGADVVWLQHEFGLFGGFGM